MGAFFRIGGLTLGVRGSDVPLEEPLARFAVPPCTPDVEVTVTHGDDHAAARGPLLFGSGGM